MNEKQISNTIDNLNSLIIKEQNNIKDSYDTIKIYQKRIKALHKELIIAQHELLNYKSLANNKDN